MQANRMTHLILHEMLEGRPMLSPTLRGPHKGPPLEQLELELKKYIRQLTSIHKLIFYQEKDSVPEQEEKPPREVEPDDQLYLRVFRRKWNEPRREGPFKVTNATLTVRSHQKRTKRKMIPEVIHCVLGARRTKREKRNRRTRVDLAT